MEIKVLRSKYDMLRDEHTALQMDKVNSGQNQESSLNASPTQNSHGNSLFDKAMERHGFNIYTSVKNQNSKETFG